MALFNGLPPGRPRRELDTVAIEGLEDFVEPGHPGRALVKSRDFPELREFPDFRKEEIKVVLYDVHSIDSFVACLVAFEALGGAAEYVGVTRSGTVENLNLEVDVSGKVVAMLGVSWPVEVIHDLVRECDNLILIFATHASTAREMEACNYPSVVRVIELGMGAAVLAWNFFCENTPVPPLLRYIEDMELGREVLRHSAAFADGFEASRLSTDALTLGRTSFGLLQDSAFLYLNAGSTSKIYDSIEKGYVLRASIAAQCQAAARRQDVRLLRDFPAWRCVMVNLCTPFASRIAEQLALRFGASCGEGAGSRCFGAVFEVRPRSVRVVLRSPPGGPDVSEIAERYEGSGHQNTAFFSVAIEQWDKLWAEPEPILWDVAPLTPQCLVLRRGDLVIIARRGERFKESPHDEWSWGYKTTNPEVEGWIPSLAHTLLVATRDAAPIANGVVGAQEGELIVARGQMGKFIFAQRCDPGGLRPEGVSGWFPYGDGTWEPVQPGSVRGLLTHGVA